MTWSAGEEGALGEHPEEHKHFTGGEGPRHNFQSSVTAPVTRRDGTRGHPGPVSYKLRKQQQRQRRAQVDRHRCAMGQKEKQEPRTQCGEDRLLMLLLSLGSLPSRSQGFQELCPSLPSLDPRAASGGDWVPDTGPVQQGRGQLQPRLSSSLFLCASLQSA